MLQVENEKTEDFSNSSSQLLLHMDCFNLFQNKLFVLNQFCHFIFTTERLAKAHTVEGQSLHCCMTTTCTLIALCIVGHLHDSNNNNKKK